MKISKLLVAAIAAILLTTFSGWYTTASPIDEKKTQLEQVKANIDKLNLTLEKAVEDYNQSQNQLGVVKRKLRKNQIKIADKQIELNIKKQILSGRIKHLYEQGPFFTLSILLKSNSFREFIDSLYFINQIAKNDNSIIHSIRKTKKILEQTSKILSDQKAQQEVLVNKVAAKKVDIESAIEEKNKLLLSVKKDLARLQAEERERIRRIREEALRKLKEQQQAAQQAQQQQAGDFQGGNSSASDVVSIAQRYLGVRYQWGGASPITGFDCSGFVWFVYNQVGLNLPRTSQQQYAYLASVGRLVKEADLLPGDLVFYGYGSATDVKMYMGSGYVIGANGGQFTLGEVRILELHYRADFFAAGRP